MDLQKLEHDLRTYRPPGMGDAFEDFVWPRYEGVSVGNLAATASQALGALLPGALPPLREDLLDGMLDGVKRVILLVLDALGWEQLQWVMRRAPGSAFHRLAEQGRLCPITTTFLSTTTSVLSTIWSGYPPVQHGQLAYEMFMREWLMAVESIAFSSTHEPFKSTLMQWGFDPEAFQPMPSVGMQLSVQGIDSYAVTLKAYVDSPLSRMNYRGAREVYGYVTGSDFWLTLRRALEAHRGERFLLSGYWSPVDTLAHTWGPFDETGDAEIRAVSLLMEEIFLNRLAPEDRAGTLLLMTADHGQITTPPESVIMLDDHPMLKEMLLMSSLGESRVPFFYVRNGRYDAAWDYLNAHLADYFVFMSQEEVIGSGLLGPGEVYVEVPHRLGDIVGIARGSYCLNRHPPKPDGEKKQMLGRHGGLAAQEMLVPLLAARLDA